MTRRTHLKFFDLFLELRHKILFALELRVQTADLRFFPARSKHSRVWLKLADSK